jgi:hypothetical protein
LFRRVTLRAVIARTAVPAPAAMQWEAVGLTFVAIAIAAVLTARSLTVRAAIRALTLLRRILRLRRVLTTGDERWQSVDAVIVVLRKILLRPWLKVLLLRRLLIILLLRILLRLRLRLRLLLRIERLLLQCRRVWLAAYALLIVAVVVKRFVTAVAARFTGLPLLWLLLIERRLGLPQMLLRGGDQAEIVFGVLIVAFRGNRIAGTLRVSGELEIFLGDVGGVASNLHVRSVGLVHARQWILVVMMVVPATAALTAVATTHALILAVSHVLQFYQPLLLFVELTCLRNINRRPVHCSHHTIRSRRRP